MGCRALFLCSAIVLGLCPPCRADLLYTVAFDQVSFESFTYPADSFSFMTPSVIPAGDLGIVGQIIPVPDGEMNGLTFTAIINETPTHFFNIFFGALRFFSCERRRRRDLLFNNDFYERSWCLRSSHYQRWVLHRLGTPAGGLRGRQRSIRIGHDFRQRSRTWLTSFNWRSGRSNRLDLPVKTSLSPVVDHSKARGLWRACRLQCLAYSVCNILPIP